MKNKTVIVACLFFVPALLLLTSPNTLATTASITTSGTVNIDVSSSGNGANVGTSDIVVNSTCPLGYTLSIAGPTDNTLYKNGDSSNNNTNQTITASSGTVSQPASILGNNMGTWGYSTTLNSTISSNYIGLTNTPTVISTKASGSDAGGDNLTVYYGVSVKTSTEAGLYTLSESSQGADDNAITYFLITNPNCDSYTIKYDSNNADNSTAMGSQTFSASDTEVMLWPSNYQRSNYGFAGWNTKADGTGIDFGPMETIEGATLQTVMDLATLENSQQVIRLYAKWVASAGNIQEWTGCSSLAQGAVTALTDTRDNNTYAVAKLADNKCWIIENLRLNHSATTGTTNKAKSQGYGGAFAGLAESETTDFTNSTTANSLYFSGTQSGTASINIGTNDAPGYRMPRYNNRNTASAVSSQIQLDSNIYSYGNYYNWSAAMANTSLLNGANSADSNSEAAHTSICPSGWKLPYGNNTGNGNAPGGFYYLNYKVNNSSNTTNSAASKLLRKYPNNFLYSGNHQSNWVSLRGTEGYYWSATASDSTYSYFFHLSDQGISANGYTSKVTGRAVRCVASEPYIISFNANGGTGTMTNQTAYIDNTVTLNANSFTRTGYILASWNTSANGSGTSYADEASVSNLVAAGNTITLYAQWECAPGRICYNDNGANSPTQMMPQSVGSTANNTRLRASNFQRPGYGFAGWSMSPNGSGVIYGPMETIDDSTILGTIQNSGLNLYAVWVPSTGNLQGWSGCSSLAKGAVIALTDLRDNDTYAVAKLADNKCWMIENLRLDNTNSDNSAGLLAQGYGGQFAGLAASELASFSDTNTANSLYYSGTPSNTATINIGTDNNPNSRFPRYNNANTASTVSMTTGAENINIYSYGNYYTWAAAIANTSHITSSISTSICPSGWRLPTGMISGDMNNLSVELGGKSSAMDSTTQPDGYEMSDIFRKYPNNFIYSGVAGNTITLRGSYGQYWIANRYSGDARYAYQFTFNSSQVSPGSSATFKYYGLTVRCLTDN